MSEDAIDQLLPRIRTNGGWYNGDPTVRRVLKEAFEKASAQEKARLKSDALREIEDELRYMLPHLPTTPRTRLELVLSELSRAR